LEKLEMIYPMKLDKKVKLLMGSQRMKSTENVKIIEEIKENKSFLVPNLLPEMQPKLNTWTTYPREDQYEIGRIFQFQFLPLGIFLPSFVFYFYSSLFC
jgi:hypothetical protein